MIIQLEGGEASGKSTLLASLKSHFKSSNKLVVTSHFPSKFTDYGQEALSFLHSSSPTSHSHFYITLLAILDQKSYFDKYHSLFQNKQIIHLHSRGILSTLVYSDLHSPYISDYTKSILSLFDFIPPPDKILYLYSPPDLIINRLSSRSKTSIYDKISLVHTIITRYRIVIDWLHNLLPIEIIDSSQDPQHTLNLAINSLNL